MLALHFCQHGQVVKTTDITYNSTSTKNATVYAGNSLSLTVKAKSEANGIDTMKLTVGYDSSGTDIFGLGDDFSRTASAKVDDDGMATFTISNLPLMAIGTRKLSYALEGYLSSGAKVAEPAAETNHGSIVVASALDNSSDSFKANLGGTPDASHVVTLKAGQTGTINMSVKANANPDNMDIYAIWPNDSAIEYTGSNVEKVYSTTYRTKATVDTKDSTGKTYTATVNFQAKSSRSQATLSGIAAKAYTKEVAGSDPDEIGTDTTNVATTELLKIDSNDVSGLQLYDDAANKDLIGSHESDSTGEYPLWIGDSNGKELSFNITKTAADYAILTFSAVDENGNTSNGITFSNTETGTYGSSANVRVEANASTGSVYVKAGSTATTGKIKVRAVAYNSANVKQGEDYVETSRVIKIKENPIKLAGNMTVTPTAIASGGQAQVKWVLNASEAPAGGDTLHVNWSESSANVSITGGGSYTAGDVYDANTKTYTIQETVTFSSGTSGNVTGEAWIQKSGSSTPYGYKVKAPNTVSLTKSTNKLRSITLTGDGVSASNDLYMGGSTSGANPSRRTINAEVASAAALGTNGT